MSVGWSLEHAAGEGVQQQVGVEMELVLAAVRAVLWERLRVGTGGVYSPAVLVHSFPQHSDCTVGVAHLVIKFACDNHRVAELTQVQHP